MALTQVTVTYDLADLGGSDFDPAKTAVYATTNVDGQTVVDTVGNQIRMGTGRGVASDNPKRSVGADGKGTLTLWAPGTGSNPASWQTTIHIDYPDAKNPSGRGRGSKSFGPFTITANADLADLVAEMPVQPEYAAAVFDLIQGYDDHGNVSGVLTLDPAIGTHVLDATGPLTVTLDDAPNGAIVTLLVTSGADDVTIDGVDDATLTDGAFATFVRVRGVWVLASAGAGGEVPVTDTTPPSSITDLAASGGDGTLTITGTNPTDGESTAKIKYRYWLTSGGPSGSYATAASFPIALTDVPAGAYTVQAYSFSNGGQQATPDSASATVTAPPGWYTLLTDTFTGADGAVTSHTPDGGSPSGPWRTGVAWANPSGTTVSGWEFASNKLTALDGADAFSSCIPIPFGTRVGIGAAVDYAFANQANSYSPNLKLAFASLTIQLAPNGSLSADNGGGHGAVTLTGTTTGHPTSGRFGVRIQGTSVSILINNVVVATGTAFENHNADTFVGLYGDAYNASTLDNFIVEEYTS